MKIEYELNGIGVMGSIDPESEREIRHFLKLCKEAADLAERALNEEHDFTHDDAEDLVTRSMYLGYSKYKKLVFDMGIDFGIEVMRDIGMSMITGMGYEGKWSRVSGIRDYKERGTNELITLLALNNVGAAVFFWKKMLDDYDKTHGVEINAEDMGV